MAEHVDPDEFRDVPQSVLLLFVLVSRSYDERVSDDRLLSLDQVSLFVGRLALAEGGDEVLQLLRLFGIHL